MAWAFRGGRPGLVGMLLVGLAANDLALAQKAVEKRRGRAVSTTKPRGLEIEATGKGPELSDLPRDPIRYVPDDDHVSREAARAILRTLSTPGAVLALPSQTLELEIDGLLPMYDAASFEPFARDGLGGEPAADR